MTAFKKRICVLGSGSWGTTVAMLIGRSTPVTLWGRDAKLVAEINQQHANRRYLPEATLPSRLTATCQIEEAVQSAEAVFIAVPSKGVRAVVQKLSTCLAASLPVISLTKGLEEGSGKRMTEIIAELLPGHSVGVFTGPNLADEIVSGMATAGVLAMEDAELAAQLAGIFQTRRFRVYINTDLIGCEISGALKNVVALACGMADGMGAGDNTRAAFITRGLAEIKRLGVVMGARPESFSGLAGMGDLIATCTSHKSRNHYVGEQLGKGRTLNDILAGMQMVAEGLSTTKTMLALGERYDIELPIAAQVNSVLSGEMTAQQAFADYLQHKLKSGSAEDEPG